MINYFQMYGIKLKIIMKRYNTNPTRKLRERDYGNLEEYADFFLISNWKKNFFSWWLVHNCTYCRLSNHGNFQAEYCSWDSVCTAQPAMREFQLLWKCAVYIHNLLWAPLPVAGFRWHFYVFFCEKTLLGLMSQISFKKFNFWYSKY